MKIYVGNLSFSTTEEDVYDLFLPFGDVVALVMINDRDTGRFRGFCFVEMEGSDAEAAIESLDGHDFNGRALRVNEARPRGRGSGPRGGGGMRGGGYGGGRGGGRRGGSHNDNDVDSEEGSRW